jgi:hypothetical protein
VGDHDKFLSAVASYVRANPDVAPRVTDFVAAGLQTALNDANQRAVDMETLVAVLATARYPKRDRDKLVAAKLRQWRGRSAMQWDSLIAELDAAAPTEAGGEGKGDGNG